MKSIVSQVIVGVLVTVLGALATTALKRHFGKGGGNHPAAAVAAQKR